MGLLIHKWHKLPSFQILCRKFSVLRNTLCKSHCYYDVLGLSKSASKKEIRAAYLEKTKEYHPDNNPDDSTLHGKFVKVTEAYEILSNDTKKMHYDGLRRDAYNQHRRYTGTAGGSDPFGNVVSEEDAWGDIDEETKRRMYEDFYKYDMPEHRKMMQEEYQRRKAANKKIVIGVISFSFTFGVIMYAVILFAHGKYQDRVAEHSAKLQFHLQNPDTHYKTFIQKIESQKKKSSEE